MAAADAEYKFTWVDVGDYGGFSKKSDFLMISLVKNFFHNFCTNWYTFHKYTEKVYNFSFQKYTKKVYNFS